MLIHLSSQNANAKIDFDCLLQTRNSHPQSFHFAGLRAEGTWEWYPDCLPFHTGVKSALLRRSFIPAEQKNVIRPLPCSSFPTAIRSAGFAVGFWSEAKQKYPD